ncbi:MAG: ECF transporter S component [Clostridia bacterium]|nr:ECF transporter S component [Clostridia bacterium]
MKNSSKSITKNKTKYTTTVGMLSAIAYIFTLVGHFLPIRFYDFLSYDPKDAIIAIAGFSLGPMASLLISLIVSFLELVTISSTGLIGFAMNVISSASFSCIAALIYKCRKSINTAALGLLISSLITVFLMVLWNYLVTPLYMGVPRAVVASMILPVFLPFNTIKCCLNSGLTMLIYKPCVQAMRRVGLIKAADSNTSKSCCNTKAPIVSILDFEIAIVTVILYMVNFC